MEIRFTTLANTEFGESSHHNIEYCPQMWFVETLAFNSVVRDKRMGTERHQYKFDPGGSESTMTFDKNCLNLFLTGARLTPGY